MPLTWLVTKSNTEKNRNTTGKRLNANFQNSNIRQFHIVLTKLFHQVNEKITVKVCENILYN